MKHDPILLALMDKLPLLRGLSEADIELLAPLFQTVDYPAGHTILAQGQISQCLWAMLDGVCEVVKHFDHAPDEWVVLAELSPYEYFGEMSFFHLAPDSASVRAKSDVKLLWMERATYDGLARDHGGAAYRLAFNVLEGMSERLRRMDEWVTRLVTHHDAVDPLAIGTLASAAPPPDSPASSGKQPEWSLFRNKLFSGWNL